MCIGIWTLEHPDYALILCTNRDEFLDRPTQNAQFHSFGVDVDPHQVLSGRDELAGGSWFGINRSGRVALLTNITEPFKRYDTSRGDLVSSFLLSNAEHPLEQVPVDAKFAGFNLLLLVPTFESSGSIRYESLLVTNHGGGGPVTSRTLSSSERSCGALCNGVDGADANLWPKVQHATDQFSVVVSTRSADPTDAELIDHLFQLLAWQPQDGIISQPSDLRKTIHVIPVPIRSTLYGTRLSTVLLVRNNGDVLFIERDIWKLGDGGIPIKSDTERRFDFKLNVKSSH